MLKQEPQKYVKLEVSDKFLPACIGVVLFFFLLFGAVLKASAATVVLPPVPTAAQGDQFFQAGDYHHAMCAYAAALRADPNNSVLADSLGMAQLRAAETAQFPSRLIRRARTNFERALQLDPQNAAALQHLIQLSTDPITLCANPAPDTPAQIERLAALNPEAAATAREQWHQRLLETQSAEARFSCSPAIVGRTISHAANNTH